MRKIISIICIVFVGLLLTGCSSNNIKEISYSDLTKAIENKETFILEIVQDNCDNCKNFTPKFNEVLGDNDLTAKSINLTSLSEEDNNSLKNLFNFNGTPTVIFITEGKEGPIYGRIVGNVSRDKIISKLKNADLIK